MCRETSRLGLRDLVVDGIKCGPHGGKKSKKSCIVSWLSLKTKTESRGPWWPSHESLPETQPLPRARFCAESQIPSSRHRDALPRAKDPALGTEKTRGTDVLCREGIEPPLGTDVDSRHRGSVPRAAEAGPRQSRHLTAQRNGRHGRFPGRQMCREPTSGSRHRAPVPSACHRLSAKN
jgi:hypothetical protein